MKKAFTIVELIIVIAVLSILIGSAIPSFWKLTNEAKQVRAEGDLRIIKLALDDYNINNHSFPTDDEDQAQAALVLQKIAVLESYCYDPFEANSMTLYEYKLSPNGLYYVVYSVGRGGAGVMTISDDSFVVTTAGNPIYVSNGTTP